MCYHLHYLVKLLLCAVAIRYFGVYSPLQKSMEYSVDTFKTTALGPGGMKHNIAGTAQAMIILR